jgi:hypothetical protein
MLFACWITKSIDPRSEYVILFMFTRQQWLNKRVSVLGLQVQCLSCEAYHCPLCWYGLHLFLCTYPFFNLVFIDIGRIAEGGIRSQNQRQQSVLHECYSPRVRACAGNALQISNILDTR